MRARWPDDNNDNNDDWLTAGIQLQFSDQNTDDQTSKSVRDLFYKQARKQASTMFLHM